LLDYKHSKAARATSAYADNDDDDIDDYYYYTLYSCCLCISWSVNWLQTMSVIIARVFLPSPTASPVVGHSSGFSATGLLF